MRCERKADDARANASNKTITYPNTTRVITNRRGHVGFTYTRVDKLHQTLRRPSAEGILNPIRIYNESLSYLLTAEILGTRLAENDTLSIHGNVFGHQFFPCHGSLSDTDGSPLVLSRRRGTIGLLQRRPEQELPVMVGCTV